MGMNALDRKITFGGELVPAFVGSTPNIIRATRKMTVTPIAGSNREYVEMEDAWNTYEQPYTMFVGNGSEDCVPALIDEVARVLNKTGWQVLLDDYEPDYYRLAYYKGGLNVENRYTRLGKFDISFVCRPERFLITGNTAVQVVSGGTLFNPTAFNAKPLIKITGSGNGTLTVNGTVMSFTNIADYLNLDCEEQNCYRLPSENRNSLMTGEFPVLKSGDNGIAFTGGISSVEITPHWWTI